MKYYTLILVLFIVSAVSAQNNVTVWGPGEGYTITFLHSGDVYYNSTVLYNFENLPVTEFNVKNFTNTGYDYRYIGYGNLSYVEHIEMIITNFPGVGTIEYPKGGFPVLLPIEFNGKSDWMESFANTMMAASNAFSGGNMGMFTSNVTISDDYISFTTNSTTNITLAEQSDQITEYQFIDLSSFSGGNLENTTITTYISYTRNTGALKDFNYTVFSYNYTDSAGISQGVAKISEQLNFVAIIPPTSIVNNVTYPFIPGITLFFAIIIIKKFNTK